MLLKICCYLSVCFVCVSSSERFFNSFHCNQEDSILVPGVKKWSSGHGVARQFDQKPNRRTREVLPFSSLTGRVSGVDSRLLNSFMKVKYLDDYGDEPKISWVPEDYQPRPEHPFGQILSATNEDPSRWDPPKKPELILDNHKHKHKYHPQNSDSGASKWPTESSDSQWPSQQDQSQWPSPQGQSQWPSQQGQSQWPSQQEQSQWPSQQEPSQWPSQQDQSQWPSQQHPSHSHWPEETQKPTQLFSKPLKVTTSSHYGGTKIPSDTILSKPVMVFDSLSGESAQNVKVVHGKVVVAERKMNSGVHQSPGKINSNFQNTIVIPIVVNPSSAENPMNTFLQTLPNVVGETDETTTPDRDSFTFTPTTTTTTTVTPIVATFTPEPTTTTTTIATTTTTTTTTTTEDPNTFIEISFKPTTTKRPTRRPTPKPTKKPPKKKKPKPKPTRRPIRPNRPGGSISLSIASLTATPAYDPGIQYVTSAPQTSNINAINSMTLTPLGYTSITGMTVVMKTLVGAMLVFLPSALVAAGIITSRRASPLAKSDEYLNYSGYDCQYDCLVELVSEMTGKEPEFIKKINNSTEMNSLKDSILDLFRNKDDNN